MLSLTLGLPACQGDANTSASEPAASSTGVAATEGSTGETSDSVADTDSDSDSDSDSDGGSTGGSSTGGDPPFELERENVRLLPYAVRLSRLTLLLDRPAEDPIFAVMNARRFELGDYDFSQNINPDLTWSTTRMSHWIAALRPICTSSVMKERYPEFPLDLPELMRDAYGYTPTSAELEPFAEIFIVEPEEDEDDDDPPGESAGDEESIPPDVLSDEARYETACIAVLTSLEFVSQ